MVWEWLPYRFLHPGKYKLVVYTANNDRSWGEQAAEMTIVVFRLFERQLFLLTYFTY